MLTKDVLEHVIQLHQELEYVRKQKKQAMFSAEQILKYYKNKDFHVDVAAQQIIDSLSKEA